jgi:hypothetical protein
MEKWGNPKVEALDVVREAMATIYDAKRTRTETAKDDARLNDLHIKWMVMRNWGRGRRLAAADHVANYKK